MNETIDSKVLEMRFDNKQFEAGVSTSMSTLDKLKSKLNLTASSKSLDDLGKAAKKCDMSGLGAGVETLQTKFSALQVIGVTALANITNSAVNAGKRVVKALTIDPVKTGLQEYETQLNAVQTILANTQKEGTTVKDVNKALDELNEYADLTIYNFTEMTRNIGTFTAAGVKLETSVNAIQGIANLAAVSGSTSQQASVAMYQLSQALAAGTIKLMDWNSVVNAGMGGQVFQDALKETSRELKTGADEAIKAKGSFRESLQTGWLTAEVLTETLKKFTTSGANEYVAKYTGLSKKAVAAALEEAKARYGEANAIDKASEALAKKSGKNKKEIKDILQFAKTAEDAATKVKTFTQLWDVLKEAAQSGWSQTWRIIIGDFEEAKELFTPLSNYLTGIIDKMSDARNNLLEGAFGMGFDKLGKNLSKVFAPIKNVTNGVKNLKGNVDNITKSLKSLNTIVDDVLAGKFGDGQDRIDKLTKAGYNYYKVQNKVNETLGISKRYSKEQITAQDKFLKSQQKTNETTSKSAKETDKLTKAQKNKIKILAKLDDEQVKNSKYTKEQIKAVQELKEAADQLGMPLDEFIDKMDEINGRWLVINSFKNIGTALIKVLSSVGKGFREVFDPIKPQQLFDAIAAFHKFTAQLIISDETADKLARTFRGLFSAIDIVTTILGGGFKFAFTILKSVLSAFEMDIFDLTAKIGDVFYKLNTWLEKHDFVTKFIDKIIDKIPVVITKLKDFVDSLDIKENAAENFERISKGIESIWNVLHGKFMLGLTGTIKLIKAVLELFGTSAAEVLAWMADMITKLADWIEKNTLSINYIDKLASIIKLLADGIVKCAKAFLELEPVKAIIEKISNAFSKLRKFLKLDFNWSSIFNVGALETAKEAIQNFFDRIEKGIKNLNNSEAFKKGLNIVQGIAKGIISGAKEAIEAIKNIGKSIIDAFCNLLGIHSPSKVFIMLGGYIIAGLLIGLKNALPEVYEVFSTFVTTIFKSLSDIVKKGIPAIYDFIKTVLSKITGSFKTLDLKASDLFVVGTVVAMLLMLKKALDIAEKVVSPIESIKKAFDKLGGVFDTLNKSIKARALKTKSEAILNFAKAIAILAASVFLLSRVDLASLAKAVGAIAALVVLLTVLMKVASKIDALEGFDSLKLATLMIGTGIALILLSKAMKTIAELDPTQATRALIQMTTLMVLMMGLIATFGYFVRDGKASKNMSKAGKMLIKMAIAIGLLVLVIKLINALTDDEIKKGLKVIGGAMAMMALFMLFSKMPNKNANKAGKMFMRMAVAIGILIFVVKLINTLTWPEIGKGAAVIAGTMVLFGLLMMASKLAGKYAVRAGAMFLGLSTSIRILVSCIKLIAEIPDSDIERSMAVITDIISLFAGVMILSNFVGDNAGKAGLMFIAFGAAIGILALTIKIISGIGEEEVNRGLRVLIAIGVIFSVIMMLSKIAGENADKAGTMFLKMSAAILILVGAMALMSVLDPTDVWRGTACIAILIAMFTLLTAASSLAADSFKTMTVLAVCIGLLAGALAGLSYVAHIDPKSLGAATAAMSSVILMMSILAGATHFVGQCEKTLIVITVAVGLIGGIIYLLAQLPWQSSLAAAGSIAIVLGAIIAALAVISAMSSVILTSLIGLAAMIIAVGAIAFVLYEIGKNADNIQAALKIALPLSAILLALSAACLMLAGLGAIAPLSIIGALSLIAIVEMLNKFADSMKVFMENISILEDFANIGIPILQKISYGIGSVIGSLVGGLMDGVTSGLPSVGKNIASFVTSIKQGFTGVDQSMAESAKTLATAVLMIAGTSVVSAISSWITGGTNMVSFGAQMIALGACMKAYSAQVSGLDTASIKSSATAAKALVEVANALPKDGGIWQSIAGSKDIGSFASKLQAFGKGMKDYANEIEGIDSSAIASSASAAKGLAEVAESLPKSDGWLQKIVGSKDIKSFGSKLKSFGKAIKSYGNEVTGIKTDSISSSVTAVKQVTSAVEAASNVDTSGVSKFVTAIKALGKADIKGVKEAFSGASSTAKMVSIGTKMIRSVGTGLKSGSASVKTTAKTIANSIAQQFSSNTRKMTEAGSTLAKALASGMSKKNASILSAGKSLASKAKSGVTANKFKMESAGKDLGSGLVFGINAKKQAAYDAGYALGKAAVQGEKDGQKSNSPSKLTIQAGKWLGEGLVIGMKRMGSAVYNAGHNIGESATESIAKALSNVGDLLDSDMDFQPTIAPVMDLSNVEAGVGAIGGMFNRTMTIGANANINAIGSMMNRRNQNGTNDDVVSAINKLRNELGNIGGDTYQLGDITYDDGSNVADAIKTIVHAAKVERRK